MILCVNTSSVKAELPKTLKPGEVKRRSAPRSSYWQKDPASVGQEGRRICVYTSVVQKRFRFDHV